MQAKDCPRCHNTFGCLMTDISQCQCAKVKISPTLQTWLAKHFDNCLCSNCLIELAEVNHVAQIVPFPDNSKDLVRKYHFYMDSGSFVFTELYHYQKGYCCGNKCRHCVYGNKA